MICKHPAFFLESIEYKRVFGLVIDFGTSQSPKSTRPLTTYWCPSSPGHQALRNNFASSLLLRTWLPMTGRAAFGGLLCFPSGARHAGKTVRPRGYRGLPAFASLSMAGSDRYLKVASQKQQQRKKILKALKIRRYQEEPGTT
ncbi:hypothetical protein, partial [Thiolapillus sp.]|uniref:hypothetical protein n=2 Tax=Thiolapillus sp. TaxID=2017437 RepID=UPI003AF49E8A